LASTRRQEIARILRTGPHTVEDLARKVGAPSRSVLADLEHVRRSLRDGDWIVHEARCPSCGFVFRGRERIQTPSRCPGCRSENIEDPRFEISGGEAGGGDS
jgi:predicted Zn-ribbon and HTH transcriptional regulator